MHAVVVADGALQWVERPDPEHGDTEVLIAVRAAGLNGADLMQLRGLYPAPAGSPADIPGLELAGEVVARGRLVTRTDVGDRVMAVVGGGGQATMAVVDESHLLAVPDSLGWAEAGGFPEVFSTAYDALFTQCALSCGERLLVTGAAGGVGVAAIQLGAAAGATVVASVRDTERRAEVTALGASQVIDADPASISAAGPYDVALELVGAASLPSVVGSLATGGRIAVIGVGSGARIELDLLALMRSRARMHGSMLRNRDRTEKGSVAAAMTRHVLPLLSAGTVRVPVCATFPMSEAPRAYDRMKAGAKLGKVVMEAPT